jgi:phage baseplate assembly protein W
MSKTTNQAGKRDIAVPLQLGVAGFFALAEEEDSVRQNLQAICSVDIGERLMRTDIGIPIGKLIFEPVSVVTESILTTFIQSQISQFETRIDVLSLSVNRVFEDANGNLVSRIRVTIYWKLKRTSITRLSTINSIVRSSR